MTLEDLIPSKDAAGVIALCGKICPDSRPFFVPVEPDSQSVILQCFQNVERKVRASGGAMIYGWEIHQLPKIHIEAQFHTVWQSPAGQFVDITPEELGMRRILFLRDDIRTYTGSRVENYKFALGEQRLVERYWELCNKSEKILLHLLERGYERGHPAFARRLGGISEEMADLKAKLCAA